MDGIKNRLSANLDINIVADEVNYIDLLIKPGDADRPNIKIL